jgi:hypothetical protein
MEYDIEMTADQLQDQPESILDMVEGDKLTIGITIDGEVVAVLVPHSLYKEMKDVFEDPLGIL